MEIYIRSSKTGLCYIADRARPSGLCVARVDGEAMAEMFCRAVNHHEALVNISQRIVNAEPSDDQRCSFCSQFVRTPHSDDCVISEARAVLQAVKEMEAK